MLPLATTACQAPTAPADQDTPRDQPVTQPGSRSRNHESPVTWTREKGPVHKDSFNHHVWKPALRRAGPAESKRADGFRALRHFYASVLLGAEESIKALSECLGHADPGFTLRVYTHLMPSSAERTRRAVDRVLGLAKDGPSGPSTAATA